MIAEHEWKPTADGWGLYVQQVCRGTVRPTQDGRWRAERVQGTFMANGAIFNTEHEAKTSLSAPLETQLISELSPLALAALRQAGLLS